MTRQTTKQTMMAAVLAMATVLAPALGRAASQCGDVNDSGTLTATDALATLKFAVGQKVDIMCPPLLGLTTTNQTKCYNDTNGNEIDCDGTGQDGELQAGAQRFFRDEGNGTILDEVTGLTWEKLSDNGDIHDRNTHYTWDNAFLVKIAALNTATFGGYSDWRVPNQFEIFSLINFGASYHSMFPEFNTGCQPGCSATTCSCTAEVNYAWSSTTNASSKQTAWLQSYIIGDPFPNSKALVFGLRAVRGGYTYDLPEMLTAKNAPEAAGDGGSAAGSDSLYEDCGDVNHSGTITAQDSLAILKKAVGQVVSLACVLRRPLLKTGQSLCYSTTGLEIPCTGTGHDGEIRAGTPRAFTNNGNGTIYDFRTGLTWEVLSQDKSFHNANAQYTWESGFETKIATLNANSFAGFSDWRVPNIGELHSLLDLGETASAFHDIFDQWCSAGCSPTECSCSPANGRVWSSTSADFETKNAWTVDIESGDINAVDKSELGSVRAVRGGF